MVSWHVSRNKHVQMSLPPFVAEVCSEFSSSTVVFALDSDPAMVTEAVTVDLTCTCSRREKRFTSSHLWLCCIMWMSSYKDTTLDTLMISSGKTCISVHVLVYVFPVAYTDVKLCKIIEPVHSLSFCHLKTALSKEDTTAWIIIQIFYSTIFHNYAECKISEQCCSIFCFDVQFYWTFIISRVTEVYYSFHCHSSVCILPLCYTTLV